MVSGKAKAVAERRARLLRDLPRALQAEERRTFAEAKRMEALGQRERAHANFEASRKAFQAYEDILAAQERKVGLDDALERANNLLMKLANTEP